MKIVSMGAKNVEGGQVLTLGVFVAGNEELGESDFAKLLDMVREISTWVKPASRDTAPEPQKEVEAPNGGRRRRASSSAVAESAPTETPAAATNASNEDTAPRRRRRSGGDEGNAGEPAPAGAAASAPAATTTGKKISNIDLAKAMTALAESVGKDDAMSFLKDDYGVEKAADITDDKRAGFLAAVREITG